MDRLRVRARRELVFLALGTMDVCVVTPLFAALLPAISSLRPWRVMAISLGVVLAVQYLARLILRLTLRPALRSGLLGLGMLASGLLGAHQALHAQTRFFDPSWLIGIFVDLRWEFPAREVSLFLTVLFLWWRGLVLAQRRIDSESVAFRFRLGVILLAVTTGLAGVISPGLAQQAYRFVFLFFFASLLGTALARAEEVEQQYGGSQSPFGLGWLAMLVTASMTVLLLAAGLAALLTGENIGLVLAPLLQVLGVILLGALYGMVLLAHLLVNLLLIIVPVDRLRRNLAEIGRMMEPFQPFESQETVPRGAFFTPEQMALLRTIGLIGVLLIVLLLVALSLRRLHAQTGRRCDEERESVWDGAHLRHRLRDLLQHGRRRLDEMTGALSHTLWGRLLAALTIRRIYALLGALAAEQGYPRASHETPYEYLPALKRAFPDNSEDVTHITEAYVAVHYGELPERAKDLALIQTAWELVQEAATAES